MKTFFLFIKQQNICKKSPQHLSQPTIYNITLFLNILVTRLLDGFHKIIHVHFPDQIVKRLISQIENVHSTEKVSPQRVKVIFSVISIFNFNLEKSQ